MIDNYLFGYQHRQQRNYFKPVVTLLVFLLTMLMCVVSVQADNHDVMDQADVLDKSTERYIYDVNEVQLSKIKGHPQIAVITKRNINGDIEDEAQQLFNQYQFGTKGYDNGVLLLIDIEGHHVRMQTGYGIESVVPDVFVNDLVDNTVQGYFRDKDFSAGTKLMVQRLAKRIEAHQGDLRTKSDVNNHRLLVEEQEKYEKQQNQQALKLLKILLCFIWVVFFIIGLLIFAIQKWVLLKFKRVKHNVQVVVEKQKEKQMLVVDFEQILPPRNRDFYWFCEGSSVIYTLVNLQILEQLIQQKDNSMYLFNHYNRTLFELSPEKQAIVDKFELDKPLSDYQVIADSLLVELQALAKKYSGERITEVKKNQVKSSDDLDDFLTGAMIASSINHHDSHNRDDWSSGSSFDNDDDDWGSFGGGGGFSGGGGGTADW
ncbi:hypothetical protein SY212_12690 [Ligilactobacillus agilis]|uniref:TPM domain-containing protein n=1 Tax=Ligilactobacillus agilis TaxID=1601 RepID=A0A6F9XLW5_9LACO|nr:TPM domain-containing protein [Ligilactobacillus agilis]GET06239.1 hypothetical protein SY212_12690 [Ligilactobacillus agilis]